MTLTSKALLFSTLALAGCSREYPSQYEYKQPANTNTITHTAGFTTYKIDFDKQQAKTHTAFGCRQGFINYETETPLNSIHENSYLAKVFETAHFMKNNGFTRAMPGLVTDTLEQVISARTNLKTGVTSTDTSYTTVSRSGMKYEK
jgi:hypothetical protein